MKQALKYQVSRLVRVQAVCVLDALCCRLHTADGTFPSRGKVAWKETLSTRLQQTKFEGGRVGVYVNSQWKQNFDPTSKNS